MSFIGVVTDSKKEESIERVLKEKLKAKKANIIMINKNSIENVKNVKFETIVITGNVLKLEAKKEMLKAILQGAKQVIVNTDSEENFQLIDHLPLSVISYGFNSKATVTASSVENDMIQLCVQRQIENIRGEAIEPQEIRIHLEGKEMNNDASIWMGVLTLCILYEVDC